MLQNKSQNIEKNIDTKTFIIHGKMRNWKTLNAICMWLCFYPRIYANLQIYQKWKSIVNFLEDYNSIKNIRFSYTPWVLIIDEAGLNVNSKDSFSKDNRIMQEILFLIGKKNLSLIWIAQRFGSIDVNARELADGIIEMKKRPRHKKHPIFVAIRQKQKGSNLKWINSYELDSISILNYYNITYNQLEESRLTKSKDLEDAKSTKNLEGLKLLDKTR